MKRRDTKALKQQLADCLGEDGKDYWRKLGEFLSLKCSKEALDLTAQSVFTTPQQIKIHNKLLVSIMYNLMPTVPTPVGVDADFIVKSFKRRKAQVMKSIIIFRTFL